MIRASDRKQLDRFIQGELSRGARQRMRERLVADEELRAAHDLRVEALRALEGREVASVELSQVETWLVDGLSPAPDRGGRRWVGLGLATAAAATALIVAVLPEDEGLVARGGARSSALAIDVMCAAPGGETADLRPAGSGCAADDVVTFSSRVDGSAAAGAMHLGLFGVDGEGNVRYYAPTPADPAVVTGGRGTWAATGVSVSLAVNHDPGEVRVYAVLSPEPPTVADVDRWAAALRDAAPAATGDLPWLERLEPATRGAACADLDRCEAVETSFVIGRTKP